jgi:hypothetical protein
MPPITKQDLRALAETRAERCASLFMPTYRMGREVQQGPIRLKNLIRQAEEQLIADAMRAADAREMLQPAASLLDDGPFWQRQLDGLALFLTPGELRHYRVPLELDELAVVNDRFHLKPLLPLLAGDGRFYVLTLNQDDIRLLECTRHSVSEVDLSETGTPRSIEEALWTDETPQKQLQFRTDVPGQANTGGGRWTSVFHGQGEADKVKEDLRRYFLRIDRGLHEVLRDERAPLVLAGVEYLLPIYEEVNSYPYLVVNKGVTGGQEHRRPEELQAKAWPLVAPLFDEERRRSMERYREALGTGLASADPEQVTPAALRGRVETLFVAVDTQVWGAVELETGRTRVREERQMGDEDLLDFTAVQTFLNGGRVFALERERMPDEASVAAVFRY